MLFDTSSKETIIQSIATMFSTDVRTINNFLNESNNSIKNLLDYTNNTSFKEVSEVTIHHITRRESVEKIYEEDILPLNEVLTQNNYITKLLNEYNINIEYTNNEFYLYYKGDIIPTNELQRCKLRFLERNGNEKDTNINGYLFQEFHGNSIRNYYFAPEIMIDIFNDLKFPESKINQIIRKVKSITNPFSVTFKVPVNEVEDIGSNIDSWYHECNLLSNGFDLEDYSIRILANSILYLTTKNYNPRYNPIMYIHRGISVPKTNILKATPIKLDKNYNVIFLE